jgi:alpha-tubulin suppressor-like RCC1 family protein
VASAAMEAATAVVMVDCGDDFTALVDESGRAWGCGANWKCQLGLGDDADEYPRPTRLLAGVDEGIESLSCGSEHMSAIDGVGRLWVWGGRFGERPSRIDLPTTAGDDDGSADGSVEDGNGAFCVLIACGSGVNLAVSGSGQVYTWGDGRHGRLGLDDGGRDHSTPQPLLALSAPARRVQCVAIGRGESEDLEEGPMVLALATPEAPEQFSEQFNRFFRESTQWFED